MKDLIAKCGVNCGRCPSYRENLTSDEARQRCSDGWHKYLGFRLSPEKLLCCDGCLVPNDENPVRYFKHGCNIRKCAVFNGVETCAHCSAYPCQDLNPDADRARIAARLGTSIPEEDYLTFIEPYQGRKHLDEIHASLGPKGIVEMTKVSVRPRFADFPADFETAAFRALYQLLTTIGVVEDISYARQVVLKKQRQRLLKIVWAFGCFGEFKEEGGPHLIIDSETFLAQRIHSNYSQVLSYFKSLGEYGIYCEHIPLTENGWLTPTKALRKGGWFMEMSFADDADGVAALKALQTYTAKLNETYGKRAFRYFSRADMRVPSLG